MQLFMSFSGPHNSYKIFEKFLFQIKRGTKIPQRSEERVLNQKLKYFSYFGSMMSKLVQLKRIKKGGMGAQLLVAG